LSANGKLDRKALPQPLQRTRDFMAPEGAVELCLAGIWRDVLGIAQIGAQDNFFELGGDSIIAIQVASRARQAGLQLGPRDLFRQQTLRELARVATAIEPARQQAPRPERGEIALTPFQQRFFEMPLPQRHHWNQALLLACDAPLDLARLEIALNTL